MDANNETYSKFIDQAKRAERYVIGCLLTESNAVMRVVELLKPEYFYQPAMACLYGIIVKLWESGTQPDMMNVFGEVMKENKLDVVGDVAEITILTVNVASTANLEDHAMFVRESYTRRQLTEGGVFIHTLGMDMTQDISDQVEKSLKAVENIMGEMDYSNPMVGMQEAVQLSLKEYEMKAERLASGKPYGLRSGINKLDAILHGFKPGELIVVGARPAMGKTAMLLRFARSIAENGQMFALFSLEMSVVSLTNRIICGFAGDMDKNAFKDGRLAFDQDKLLEAVNQAQSLSLMVDDTPHLSVHQIKVRAMNLKRKKGLAAIGIDYLQLMNTRSDNRSYNREQEISQTTRKLKQLAKELEVPIILLSQLNRNIESKTVGGVKTTSLPQLSDLRESGAIEQDADVVLLIHRPEYYEDTNAPKGVGMIIVAKNREGKTAKVKFKYSEDLSMIADEGPSMPF